ncbi:MAG: PASTA domain-containing protein, partial [Terriglobia bacterium]
MSRKKKKSSKEFHQKLLTVGKFALLIGGLIAVGLSSAYMGMRFAVRGSEVEVPSIVGKPLEQAMETLKKVELKLEVLGERFDPQIGKGAVLSQHPQPGRRIKVQRKVQVILSLGEKRNPVPDLRGSTLRVARLMASQSGFELGHITEISISGV